MRRNQLRMRKSRNCCAQPWQLRLPEYAQIDVSAAIENLLLEADGLGLGAVWLGIAPLTERMDAFAIVPCGCPAQERVQQDRFEEARVHYIR